MIVMIALSFCLPPLVPAAEKDPASGREGNGPCPADCKAHKTAPVRAVDWVNAWQIAKAACTNANALTIQLVDRSGPTLQSLPIFECVDLRTSGELLVISLKKTDGREESVMIVRAADLLRIEVARRAAAQN